MNKQLQIKSLRLKSPLILAPLAGYTDLPFRLLCRRFGAGLCYTEMISCHGLVYQKEKTLRMTRTIPEERPVALQLFGADPEKMGQAAALVSEMQVDIIDINIPTREMNLKVSDEELAERRIQQDVIGWKAIGRVRPLSAALKVYAMMATSADKGAVRDISKLK